VRRVAVVDDLFTSGITAAVTAEALEKAGAEVVGVYCLAMTERTENRPLEERQRLLRKRARRAARQTRQGAV